MVLLFMIAMMVDHYETASKKIEPSIYVTVNEKPDQPFQPRQYIRKREKEKNETK
ncbi:MULTISPECIES: hypothetical protein [Anoxybacillus]|uniref:hypothetical protein n=1 Tax=Anoxybacillus TaxID=150247 RepID=UPI000B1D6659|nr:MULTISPECIES: hypothetical protein [Anoxybacillus]